MTTTSRRCFVVGAGGALSLMMVAGSRAAGPQKPLGVALCGLGSLSTNQIAPALQKTRLCKLTGIVTGTPEKARRWQAQYGIPAKNVYDYHTFDRMIDNPDIDVVYVVTPNALHAEHTIKAARAGKHVFCEKPMEISVERCQQMIDECKKAGRKLGVGYRCQFEPHHLEMMRLAREREFGDVKVIEASFGFTAGDPKQWRLRRELSGGGALMDVGVYALQASRYISGEEPIEISAIETKTDPVMFREVDESIVWQMRFPSGRLATCSTTYNANGMGRIRAHAQRGWFALDPAFNYTGIRGERSDGKAIAFPATDHFAVELDAFARSIIDDQPFLAPGEEGLRDVSIMMSIYEAARTGRVVKRG
ncbi:Gfo/Idh/MocA family oxidoreductase [Povalibacter sp.]|uniref:Gfo/Idh/MocA family protein n=1 Tax=Povalibacter sp. TaxID=1962978 RepID=UPI002F41BBDC